jgi:hypothetical protein
MSKLLALITLLIIPYTIQVLLGMDGNKKRCISKDIGEGDTLHLSFVVTGDDNNERTKVILQDPSSKVIFQKENVEDGEYKREVQKPGQYKLCFFPTSGKSHFISFEFYSIYERGHTLNLAKDGKFVLTI